MIVFHCPCGRRLRAPDGAAGKSANCPACRRRALVPATRPVPLARAQPVSADRQRWPWVVGSFVLILFLLIGVSVLLILSDSGNKDASSRMAQKVPEKPVPKLPPRVVAPDTRWEEPRLHPPAEKANVPDSPTEQPATLPKVEDVPAKKPVVEVPKKTPVVASRLRRFLIWQGVWDQFNTKQNYVGGTAFSPDRRKLAATYMTTRAIAVSPTAPAFERGPQGVEHVTLWDVETGVEALRLKPATLMAHPRGPSFSPDGKRLLVISGSDILTQIFGSDASLRLWDTANGTELANHQPTREFKKNPFPTRLACAAFTPDGEQVVTGNDMNVGFENGKEGDPDRFALGVLGRGLKGQPRRLPGHTAPVAALAFTPDGKYLFTASGVPAWVRNLAPPLQEDDSVRQWELATSREVRRFVGQNGAVTCLAVSPDGKWLLTGGHDSSVRCWDIATGELIRELAAPPSRPTAFDVSSDGHRVLVCAQEHVLVYDIETGRELLRLRTCRQHLLFPGLTNGVFSPDDERVLIVVLDELQDAVYVEEWQLPRLIVPTKP